MPKDDLQPADSHRPHHGSFSTYSKRFRKAGTVSAVVATVTGFSFLTVTAQQRNTIPNTQAGHQATTQNAEVQPVSEHVTQEVVSLNQIETSAKISGDGAPQTEVKVNGDEVTVQPNDSVTQTTAHGNGSVTTTTVSNSSDNSDINFSSNIHSTSNSSFSSSTSVNVTTKFSRR